ncbi:RsmB/NOP family class I SAM-dependent RNA methyltransferase [Sphingobium boeckii]|uniref:16S rRNA (Cytosine967-C5)-methyltransferase n=1 Tax=Sphingobium boeckii TaxID=1082345 RepID=A0A7W9AKJ7_9SPHN|nr:RsmB/NOP family class I SAM-dependent RNA methyltransferase [Sphingobium boeckii]MBB5687367.1 16S rRNA (cytosine967-C5)-methyltransferase [Sphingobium boeckii]
MTPSAQLMAAIELLDAIIVAAQDGGAAADTIIARYFKTRRYAGSKDRRAVREHVYAAIRAFGARPKTGRAAMAGLAVGNPELAALFDGVAHGPKKLGKNEGTAPVSPVPEWLQKRLPEIEAKAPAALLGRAPLDVRVNRLKAERDEVLAALPEGAATPHSPLGIRLPEGFAIEAHDLWAEGKIEIQDEGSQLLALTCKARPGMTVIDLCAGAGGKTLALAAEMANEGRLIASDTVRSRLDHLKPRAERAGATMIETKLLDGGHEAEDLADLKGVADIVLVDAPCSGTGTWRRNPEARWRLNARRLEALQALQAHIIDLAVPLLKPGGVLVYAVCSLLESEGADQVSAALTRHSSLLPQTSLDGAGRRSGAGTLLSPVTDQTDGFFVARLKKA